jgi:Holliday junction resolvase
MTKRLSVKLKLSENDVKKMVKEYLSIKGWFHFHLMAGMGSFAGAPDIIAIKDGKVLFIECKRPKGGKQSPKQVEFQHNIEDHGGTYLLVRDLNDLMEVGI